MQVSDLYILDLYAFYVYMACLGYLSCMILFSAIYSLANFKFCHNYKGI